MTLGKMLEETAQQFPKKCAIKFEKRKISYKELNISVNKAAHALMSLGIKKGDRVGILSDNCPEYIISYFAILKFGGIAVPINSFLTGNEIKYIVNDCQVKVLVTSKKFLRTIQPVISQMSSILKIIVINETEQNEYLSFEALLASGKAENIQAEMTEQDLAVFIYTSGTTGHPKGAMLSHYNLFMNVVDAVQVFKVIPKDKFLLFLPMFHSFTFTVCVLLPLKVGSTIVLIGSAKALDSIKKAIIFDRVTLFVGVPAVYNVLANKPLPKILRYLNAIRAFVSGSAPLPAPVIEKIEQKFNSVLCEGYGLSEASPVVSVNPIYGTRKVGSVGPALPSVQVKVVDENMKELPIGEVGELAVKGPNVMQGYFNLPEETQKTVVDGWLLTGDIAKLDEEGYIYIVDRKKEMLLVRGVNVYPREIEDVLYTHPGIVECAVIGVPDETKGEVPKAFIVVREGETLAEQEVRDFCKKHLAGYKLPKYIEFRTSLPKNATQKIMKRDLR
ncbi:MAG: long-chain fatty acid--CoA ligase [Candidatus Vecturithrix sp.]|jgi:long-chain acyl-CoA synthetase|nr:long-chain fatty acid--CoA ligase [Candidatus Vecturithrix sp.]